MMNNGDPRRLHDDASRRETGARDGGTNGERHVPPSKEKGARARGRMRSTERGWLEDQLPEKRHSGLLKADFQAALELLLESQCPREYTDTFNSAVHLADVSDTWARSQMRALMSSQGPFMAYEEGGVMVLDYRTTEGTA